ncbi:BsuPI-related putative proteinase inhibitor [Halalkalibacter alkalisediminis]|uniref:Intracellular proteinase inhibitor BsuPI domain-containing protein n=1 Tax=Halalkalibacter alkalisediminis TaxID=935616 RepID=A0ABV6NBA2_9BACI|nr:BsuPI-related putative proteinase inhibitor [Halalkalibacter alkalisediminis]
MRMLGWFITLLFALTACGTAANAPLETNEGDGNVSDSKWLFDVETEQTNGELLVTLTVTNNQEKASSIDFSSGQKYELVLLNEEGAIEYRYSEGMMFTMALIHETFEPSESKVYEERIPLDSISAGSYILDAQLVLAAVDGSEWKDADTFHKQVKVEIK